MKIHPRPNRDVPNRDVAQVRTASVDRLPVELMILVFAFYRSWWMQAAQTWYVVLQRPQRDSHGWESILTQVSVRWRNIALSSTLR